MGKNLKFIKLFLFIYSSLMNIDEAKCFIKNQNSISIVQGQVEVVCKKKVFNELKNNTILDSMLQISQSTLLELEKNLIYKMSDNVHLILFNDLNEYADFQRNHFTGKFENEDFTPINSEIYFPIFMVGNLLDIKIQIRYGISKQFIDEYLFGLTIKEKVDNDQNERIPNWLLSGFVNYFANSIQLDDFQKFEFYNNKGYFKNVNNIPLVYQPVFGTVLWYLFEKEKGKKINSAFWNLIKNANSFEQSFEYQFEKPFRIWLKERIQEIENDKSKRNPNFDIQIGQSQFNDGIIKRLCSNQISNINLLQIENPLTEEIYEETNNKPKLLLKSNLIGLYPNLRFNSSSIFLNANKQILLFFKDGVWRYQSPTGTQILGSTGIYHTIQVFRDSVFCIHEYNGKNEIISLTGNKKSTYLESKNFNKIIDFQITDSAILFSLIQVQTKNNQFQSAMISHSKNRDSLIYSENQIEFPIYYTNIIVESKSRISFLRNVESKQSLLFLESKSVKALDTKGLFYKQILSAGGNTILESFYLNKNFYANELNIGEDFELSDTFKPKEYSFDTINISIINKQNVQIDSNFGYYLSAFKNRIGKKKPHYLAVPNLGMPKLYEYERWFYPAKSTFYLSNKELDLPYSIQTPLNSLYNSIFTLFYEGMIKSSDNKHSINFMGFTNSTRRRIGVSFNYNYTIYPKLIYATDLNYRLREFSEVNSLISNRNRTLQIEQKLKSSFHNIDFSLSAYYRFQQLIYLNYNPGMSEILNKNDQFLGLKFSMEVDSRNFTYRNSPLKVKLNASFSPENYWNLNLKGSSGNLAFNLLTEYKINILRITNKINSKVGLGKFYTLYFIGGSQNWINENQFNTNQIGLINNENFVQIQNGGYVRGFLSGDRIGSSFITSQTEFQICPIHLIPLKYIESKFLKSILLIGFIDIGTAYLGNSPSDLRNPYNTLIINNPNYTISVVASRNPYLLGTGYGLQFDLFGFTFKSEYAYGYKENSWQKPILHVGIGKNF